MPDRAIQESELMSQRRAEEIFGMAVDAARSLGVRDVEVMIGNGTHALTRFANNTIHQNVAERSAYLSVRALIEGRTARASTNRLDTEGIRRVVEEAVSITRLQAPDPDLLPLAEPERLVPIARFFAETAAMTPADRAGGVHEAIGAVEAESQTAAGIYSSSESSLALLNTR